MTVIMAVESSWKRLKEWEEQLAKREQQIAEREQQIAEREQQIAEQERQLREREQQRASLNRQIELLQEQRHRSSKNSSMPPSSDPPHTPKQRKKKSSGRKRGGQLGHEGHSRVLYPVEACDSVLDYHPQTCRCCGERLQGEDTFPYRHQVQDIPPITPIVTEHRLHQLVCGKCGIVTRAQLPDGICLGGYGARVVAMVGLLSGLYRHSHRMVQSAMQDLFGISIALGTINRLRTEASVAVAASVAEVQEYVQQQPVVGADETSFAPRNADGWGKPGKTRQPTSTQLSMSYNNAGV